MDTPSGLSEAHKVDLFCDEYEQAWMAGRNPVIEDYITGCDPTLRALLLEELVLVECELRRKRGGEVARQEFENRFRNYLEVVARIPWESIDTESGRPIVPLTPLAPGSRLAQFELLNIIGFGAFGTVWSARDHRLGRSVALKVPRQERLSEAERERFLREGRAAAKLRHPNIVTLFEVGEDSGRSFIVSELVEGAHLRVWFDQQLPGTNAIAELLAFLAEALHHAHERGVIHRDLKPANVLVDCDGRPHITDFGLAKLTSDIPMTLDGHVLGTPAYMSPEQASGDVARADCRTDVYGLGAVLYELLTKQPPFTGDPITIVHQVMYLEPPLPRTIARAVPRDLETICLKALAKEPKDRYPTAQEMAVDLHRFLRGETILSRRINIVGRTWRRIRRHPGIMAAVVVLLVVVATATAMIRSLNHQNYQLQGYRPVMVTTTPAGARVAFVPIDNRTGEPDPNPTGIIRPNDPTPFRFELKPGKYFIEVAYRSETSTDIAEEQRTIPGQNLTPEAVRRRNKELGYDEDLFQIPITITSRKEIISTLVAVPVSDALRRKYPLLPSLLYIDPKAADLKEGERVTLDEALRRLTNTGKRLPSAAEYDAIDQYLKDNAGSHIRDKLHDLVDTSSRLAEWTTTRYRYGGGVYPNDEINALDMQVLRNLDNLHEFPGLSRTLDGALIAPPNVESPFISYRGVCSGAPRFVTQ